MGQRKIFTTLGSLALGGLLLTGAATPASAAANVIADPTLQACINVEALKRNASTPITAGDLSDETRKQLDCKTYPGIRSFEGLQDSAFIRLKFNDANVSDLSPLDSMPRLLELNVAFMYVEDTVLDLTQMQGTADTLTTLELTNASNTGGTPNFPLDSVIGIDAFTNLTILTFNASGITLIPGLEALVNLEDVRVGGNFLGNEFVQSVPTDKLKNLFFRGNGANDFSSVPVSLQDAVTIDAQRYVSDEVIFKPAGATDVVADPVDRAVGAGNTPATLPSGAPDQGAITFSTMISPQELVSSHFAKALPTSDFKNYATYQWQVACAKNTKPSYTAFPVVTVDLVDNHDLQATQSQSTRLNPFEFTYDAEGPQFAPASFALDTGSLPAGLTLSPTTGEISGTPTTTGTTSFTVAAIDALGNRVLGDYTLTVSAADLGSGSNAASNADANIVGAADGAADGVGAANSTGGATGTAQGSAASATAAANQAADASGVANSSDKPGNTLATTGAAGSSIAFAVMLVLTAGGALLVARGRTRNA